MKMSRELKLVLFLYLFPTGDWSLITSSELQALEVTVALW
jgi:hypothetical protein